MATAGLAILPVLLCLFLVDVCSSYNIDVVHARVLHGPGQSMFGYASAFKRTQSGYKIIVGAPKDNSERRNSTGATHECNVTEPFSCVKMHYTRENKEAPSGAWYVDNEMYGSVIVQTNDTTTVCAPRFNDLRYEASGRAFLIGRCVHDNVNTRPEEFYPLDINTYFKTISLDNGISKSILWNGMGQAGMSGDAMRDGSVLIGVPGFKEWKGGVVLLKKEGDIVRRQELEMPFRIPDDSYLGYSVITGKLCGQKDTCFAAGAPRAEMVHIVNFISSVNLLSLVQSLEGEQIQNK